MISHEDLARWWGKENLCRLSAEALDAIDLPERAKAALSEMGLPCNAAPLFVADLGWHGGVPTMIEAPSRRGRWYRIGWDTDPAIGPAIGVEAESGEVLSISPDGQYQDRFVNSSLDAFITFLYLVSRARATFPNRSDEVVDAETASLEHELRRLDPKALAHPDNWWSAILEQMKDGLL